MEISYCEICGFPFNRCFCNRDLYQIDYYSTGNLKYVGDCPRCGYPCFEGIWHECPTCPTPPTETRNLSCNPTDILYKS